MISAFTSEQRATELAQIPAWRFDERRNALYRKLIFRDFAEALAFMVRVGVEAEKADHHPEWTNVYNKLEIWLTTHDAGGVSQRDTALAKIIDGFVEVPIHPVARAN
jgi:4a-hydroxytetrahydrobiopterin dehydratase